MKYLHPDVLVNGPALIRNSAVRALLLPSFNASMTYAEAVAAALLSGAISSTDFTFSFDDNGDSRMVFTGTQIKATQSSGPGNDRHVAYTDGASRILWVDRETSGQPIFTGQFYRIPAMTLISGQAVDQP